MSLEERRKNIRRYCRRIVKADMTAREMLEEWCGKEGVDLGVFDENE